MKRNQSSRAPSPTPTTFSGISNYRTESYRPIRDQGNVPAVPSLDLRAIARTHYNELSHYLAAYLAKAPPNSRSAARQKLTRLTKQQFQELSTDVYDELLRRKTNTDEIRVSCLPPRDDFHPKRNQARQKLATLPTARFEDLSSDVFFELSRRYPEFKEELESSAVVGSPQSTYDEVPSSDFHASPRSDAVNVPTGLRSGRISDTMDSGYGSGTLGKKSSQDGFNKQRHSEEEVLPPRRSDDLNLANPFSARRKPSQDMRATAVANAAGVRGGPGGDFGRRPSASASIRSDSSGTTGAQSATATSGMIIPNKSMIAEEDIEVPYGREIRDSLGTAVDDRDQSQDRGQDGDGGTDGDNDSMVLGLNGLSARLRFQGDVVDDGIRSGEDGSDKVSLGRASVISDRSATGIQNIGSRMMNGWTNIGAEEQEWLRREYEIKVATMQKRISTLERGLVNAEQREEELRESQQRIQSFEADIDSFRQRAEEHGTAMKLLQEELHELREARTRDKEREAMRMQESEMELQILRDRCECLEEKHRNGAGQVDKELMEQLRSDMESLMTELTDLGRRNDELMTAKEADLTVIRDLDNQLKEYKRRYEQAKTELRSVKATSQLFTQSHKMDDQLPMAQGGGLIDVHITAFISSIDSLLAAGRSSSPTRVLLPMKAVVTATSAIIEDVKVYEARPTRADVDLDNLSALRERAEATLSNLVAASRMHATSAGMAPVSLLDAAASHVSATVTELAKMIFIRKTARVSLDERSPPLSGSELQSRSHSTVAYSSSLRLVDELRSSFSGMNSPPALHQSPELGGSDHSASSGSGEDAWAELRPYLEAQTSSIVSAIQNVLSGVRSPNPAPALNENLTQIITIVSSIVAVCSDNLPPTSAQQGAELLKDLRVHAETLQDVQQSPEVTKESRQVMAKSSFAIANAMKGLMKL